jgi:uncharacterized protein YbjT (DUF2867 family)
MILVTGAAGNNGQATLRVFARQGVRVRALVRDEAQARLLQDLPGVELVVGDLAKPESLGPTLEGVERALLISSATPDMFETQCAFIDAAKAAGVPHVVKLSGKESNIGFDPEKFLYTRMHGQVEQHLEASGMAWTHLRPCQFMYVYLWEAPTIAKEGVLRLATGDVDLAPIDVDDVAKIAFHVLTKDGNDAMRYDMTGPQALTMAEVAGIIGDVIGKPVRYLSCSPEERRADQLAAGLPPALCDALYDENVERLKHPRSRVVLETHKHFGIEPTTFADFIQRHKQLFL